MPFPTKFRIQPVSVSTANALLGVSDGNEWVKTGTPVEDPLVSYELTDAEAISMPFGTRWVAPLLLDHGFDLTYEHATTGTRSLHMVICDRVDGINTLANLNSGFDLWIRSNDRIVLREKSAGGAWTTLHDISETADIVRVVLRLRRFNWTAGSGTAGQQWELDVHDSGGLVNSYSGSHSLNINTWNIPSTNYLAPNHGRALIHFEVVAAGTSDTFTLTDFKVPTVHQAGTTPTVCGPVLDGFSTELPDFDPAEQPYLEWAHVDITGAPFNADNTGTSLVTQTLRDCLNHAKDYGAAAFLPAGGVFDINGSIVGTQYVTQRTNASASARRTFVDEFGPNIINGGNQGAKPIIHLRSGSSGFESSASPKTVIEFRVYDYNTVPPVVPGNLNASYNQCINNVRIDVNDNPGAIAIQCQGAQGTELERIELTATNGFVGIDNFPGSGGAIHTVDVTGFDYAFRADASQPAPTITGVYVTNPNISALRINATGNRQNLLLLGWGVEIGTNRNAIDAYGPGDADGNNFSTQRGQLTMCDGYIDFASPNAGNCAFRCKRSLVLRNVYVRNCQTLVEHPSGNITCPVTDDWVHIIELVIPYDPPTYATGGLSTPSNYPFDAANRIDGVRSTANIITYGTGGVAPPADIVERHRITDAEYKTFQDVTIEVAGDPDGYTHNTTAIAAAMAAATAGDVVGFRAGYWISNEIINRPAGVHMVGGTKVASWLMGPIDPAAGATFGSSGGVQYLLDTPNSALQGIVAHLGFWMHPETTECQAARVRDNMLWYSIHKQRRSRWGYGSYASAPGAPDSPYPMFLLTGDCKGRWYTPNIGNGNNSQTGFSFIKVTGRTMGQGVLWIIAPDGEHAHSMPGQWEFDDFGDLAIANIKSETNWHIFSAKAPGQLLVLGIGGNSSGFIADSDESAFWTWEGAWATANTYQVGDAVSDDGDNWYCITAHTSSSGNRPSTGGAQWENFDDRGLNPEPATGFTYTPCNVFVENFADNPDSAFIIYQTQDEIRITGGHPTFGKGTAPDKWHYGVEVDSGAETLVLPFGDRPTKWSRNTLDFVEDGEPPPEGLTPGEIYWLRRRREAA